MPRHKVTKFATMKNAARFRPEIEEPGKEAPKEGALLYGDNEEHLNQP
jgi:hypothetical protein